MTLAYYTTEFITAIKSFTIQTPAYIFKLSLILAGNAKCLTVKIEYQDATS
jgi:hypothetical protein